MIYRALAAGCFVAASLGLLAAGIAFRPDAAFAVLATHVESSELRPDKPGAWEFYADADAVRRNSMDRQRKAMSAPLLEQAEREVSRFKVAAVPLGVVALVSGIAWMMLGRRVEDVYVRPIKRRGKPRNAVGPD